jgi:hypothetical protein
MGKIGVIQNRFHIHVERKMTLGHSALNALGQELKQETCVIRNPIVDKGFVYEIRGSHGGQDSYYLSNEIMVFRT